MKIIDHLNKRQLKKLPADLIESFQVVLTANLTPAFQNDLDNMVDKAIRLTGSCVVMPGNNTPAICRAGITRLQETRKLGEIIIPMVHNVFGTKPNPGDPLLFCLIAHTPGGILFEWDNLYDQWKRGKIEIPRTDAADMRSIDMHVNRELKLVREYDNNV